MKVENGCNAVNVTILLWAAMLTYPAPWVQKLKGLAAGSLALHAVNLLRIITLYYLGQYNKNWFDFAHYYLWECLIVLDTLVIFWFWASLVRRGDGNGMRPPRSPQSRFLLRASAVLRGACCWLWWFVLLGPLLGGRGSRPILRSTSCREQR